MAGATNLPPYAKVTSKVLQTNIKTLGVEKQTYVHTAKVENFLSQHKNSARAAGGAFDFVSFCPPYYKVGGWWLHSC